MIIHRNLAKTGFWRLKKENNSTEGNLKQEFVKKNYEK